MQRVLARELSSSSSSLLARLCSSRKLNQLAEAIAPEQSNAVLPRMPPFDYTPPPYTGPRTEEILRKRSDFLSPSMFYFYKKPVRSSLCNPFSVIWLAACLTHVDLFPPRKCFLAFWVPSLRQIFLSRCPESAFSFESGQ